MKYCYLFLGYYLPLLLNAQPTLAWYKEIGGFSEENATCVLQLADGNILFAGQSASNEGDITCGNHGNKDVYLLKYDVQGNMLWQQHYGGTEDDLVTAALEMPNGEIVFCGYTQSNDIDVSGAHGNFDYWLARVAADGTTLWTKTYGGTNLDAATCLQAHADGGLLVGGYAHSTDGDKSQSLGNSDFWLVHTDSQGNLLWEKSYGGSADDRMYGLCLGENGGFLLAGEAFSTDGDVLLSNGAGDMLVLRIDDSGNVLWRKNYGGALSDYVSAIAPDHLGGYYVAGKTYSNNNIFPNHQGKLDFSLLRIKENGDWVWAKSWGGSENELAFGLTTFAEGKWMMLGDSYSNDGDVAQNMGNADVWVLAGDSVGNVLWQKVLGGNDKDEGLAIAAQNMETVYLAGLTRSTTFQETALHGNGDFLFAKLATSLTISADFLSDSLAILLHQSSQQLEIQHLPATATSLSIYNYLGQTLWQSPLYTASAFCDISQLPPGTYLLQIQLAANQFLTKKFYKGF